jgi:outer membrane cobalamin receptor
VSGDLSAQSTTPSSEEPIADESYSAVAEVEAPVREVSRHTVERQDLMKIPGTSGDALRAIEVMPGVARTSISSGDPLLRGAAWNESRSYIEGATVPLLYHFGGVKSAFNSRLLSRVDLYPGNYSASMGRGVGGVVSARIRDPERDRLHALAELSVIDSTALVETPLGKNAAVAVAARRSNIGLFYDAFAPKSGFSVTAVPTYYDYQGLGFVQLGTHHQLRVMSYGSRDALQLVFANPSDFDPALRDKVDFSIAYHRLQTALRSELTSRVTQNVQVTLGYTQLRQMLGAANAQMGEYDLLSRGEWNVRASDSIRVDLGYDLEAFTMTGYYVGNRPPQAEGEVMNGGASSEQVVDASNIGHINAVRPAVYGEVEWHPTQSLLLVPGVRVDRYSDQGAWTVDPRLSARYELTPRIALKWGIGIYSQNPQYYELLPALGNPRLKPYHAQQTSAGVEHRPSDSVSWGLEGFYKRLDNRIVSTPGGAPPYFTNAGVGRIYGAELFARYTGGRLRAWLAYTLSRSERQDRTDPWRLFERDQTHILAIAGNYDLGRGWEFGGRFRLTSGNPYTPVNSAVFDANSGTYQPINAAPFSARNPVFQQLDLRVEKLWQFTQWKLACFLDVQNVYNARNNEGFDYSYDYRRREAIAGLPLLPNLGVRGEI